MDGTLNNFTIVYGVSALNIGYRGTVHFQDQTLRATKEFTFFIDGAISNVKSITKRGEGEGAETYAFKLLRFDHSVSTVSFLKLLGFNWRSAY